MKTRCFRTALFLSCVAGWVFSSGADAQEAAPALRPVPAAKPSQAQTDLGTQVTNEERPWAKAVKPEDQKVATDLFREGNGLLKESLYVQASQKYKEALTKWDHPGIHYNLALALLNLDQPVEVYQQLEEAMKFGPAPLDADKFQHASRYKTLIEKQLARVEVRCTELGAQVTMDGRILFTAPGRHESLVRIGQHSFVGTKLGFVPTQKTPLLPPGQKTIVDLKMFTDDQMTIYKRRWHNAIPWTVFGAGVVIAGVGGVLHWQSSEQIKAYDKGILACGEASATGGCTPDDALRNKKTHSEALQIGAFAAYGIGAATVIIGSVLAVVNRAKPERVNPDKDPKISISPIFAPGGAGVVTTIQF